MSQTSQRHLLTYVQLFTRDVMRSKSTSNLQSKLKAALQADPDSSHLERFAAAAIGRLLGVEISVAKSGFQHGGDAGPSGRQGRRFRIESKKYADHTSLSDRELLGEIDHALNRDPALEAWILVSTREVSEKLEQDLILKGESLGVPVIVLDFKPEGFSSLAALCAFAPDLVKDLFSGNAAALARDLEPFAASAIDRLRRDLAAWNLGFERLRSESLSKLRAIWTSPRESNAALGQNAAGGAIATRIRRRSVDDALDAWWSVAATTDAPAALVGWDGVGKTWAALDWLLAREAQLPIVLIVPSSAAVDIGESELAVKRFLAGRLYELTGVRDPTHWFQRLKRLLQRPIAEGPVLTVLLDGLNQELSVRWLRVLKVLQGTSFAGRIRTIVSTRPHHYQNDLVGLQGLVVPASRIPVDIYDSAAGGELDQMLALRGLSREALHSDLVDLARTPRLFSLVVQFKDRLVEAGQVTVHRLLWEYGRDSFGTRAGRSFSEEDWRDWLQEVARRHLQGVRTFSRKDLADTASRRDLTTHEVAGRLSDIIDGQFTTRAHAGQLQLTPTIVAHALGAALLATLDDIAARDRDTLFNDATQWLDPISGLDQRSEVLRAAVSIWIERGGQPADTGGVLIALWLQTQNMTELHRRELAALAPVCPEALLDALERSRATAHSSALACAVNGLRAVNREDQQTREAIVQRARRWCAIVSRGVGPARQANKFDDERARRFVSRVGVDVSGPLTVLGRELQLVDWDDGLLQATVPVLLEGYPLASALSIFETTAIAVSVSYRHAAWNGLKWLVLLNAIDGDETRQALRRLSADVGSRDPEAGIHPMFPPRAAALLLWLTGAPEDERAADDLAPGWESSFDYERDYLADPSRSFFELERRHAQQTLEDTTLQLLARIQRVGDLWLDLTFEPSQRFCDELRGALPEIDVEKLSRHSGTTSEDLAFERLQPALARCAPDALAQLAHRQLQSWSTCPPEERYWSALHATQYFLVADEADRQAVRSLRLSSQEQPPNSELYAATQLLILELKGLPPLRQAEVVLEAELEEILLRLGDVLQPLSVSDADALIARFKNGTALEYRNLLLLLSVHATAFGESALAWLRDVACDEDEGLRGIAYRALATADAERFGRELFARGWSWSASDNHWVTEFGTAAVIGGTGDLPFDQIAPRLPPWALLQAAQLRGGDPGEVRLAATILSDVIAAKRVDNPDPGANIAVDRSDKRSGLPLTSITPRKNETNGDLDLAERWKQFMDAEGQRQAYRRAVDTAIERIRAVRESGGSLYLVEVQTNDVELALACCPEITSTWLEGSGENTTDFRRRVQLAEGVYIALCEALLKRDPKEGAVLWRSLWSALATEFTGDADLNELLHLPFRVPSGPEVDELRAELLTLRRCNTDKHVFEVAVAASSNRETSWLKNSIEVDRASTAIWRHTRAVIMDGFLSHNTLPVDGAWPEGEVRGGHEHVVRVSARRKYLEACAHHWWRTYWAAADATEALAAWTLFLLSADRRAWVWMDEDASTTGETALASEKMIHVKLNRERLARAMRKREDRLERQFLGRDIETNLRLWGGET